MSERDAHPFESRLGRGPEEPLTRILEKRVDGMLRQFPAEIAMDMAHTVMLAEQGILSRDDATSILSVLRELEAGGPDALPIDRGRSTLFWNVEKLLIDRLGENVGGRMHTGRSHNDILPTISRLTARDRTVELLEKIVDLQESCLAVAAAHVRSVMPGYTSLQHGQPWTFGHYMSGWSYALERDFSRVEHAFETTNQSPLGASALAGTSWPLDRARTADLLGFDDVMVHSRDAGFATKDYVAETLAAISILMSNIASVSTDLYVWSSFEFGMVELADGYSGSSSFMPQKKNPWAVDWARGAAGNAIGYLASSLGAMKGATSTDGSAQTYPEAPLANAFDDAVDYLELISGAIATMTIRTDVMRARATAGWTTASNLADTIVRETGISFRSAHGIVARIVRDAVRDGVSPVGVTSAMVDVAAEAALGRRLEIPDDVIVDALDAERFLDSRVTVGSVNPLEVERMLGESRSQVANERDRLERRRSRLAAAARKLDQAVVSYVG